MKKIYLLLLLTNIAYGFIPSNNPNLPILKNKNLLSFKPFNHNLTIHNLKNNVEKDDDIIITINLTKLNNKKETLLKTIKNNTLITYNILTKPVNLIILVICTIGTYYLIWGAILEYSLYYLKHNYGHFVIF